MPLPESIQRSANRDNLKGTTLGLFTSSIVLSLGVAFVSRTQGMRAFALLATLALFLAVGSTCVPAMRALLPVLHYIVFPTLLVGSVSLPSKLGAFLTLSIGLVYVSIWLMYGNVCVISRPVRHCSLKSRAMCVALLAVSAARLMSDVRPPVYVTVVVFLAAFLFHVVDYRKRLPVEVGESARDLDGTVEVR